MPYGTINVDKVVDTSGGVLAPISSVFRNRIINGAMVIDQRNAGASVTIPAATTTYTIDRWCAYGAQASKFSVQRNAGSVTPPEGYTNYLGVTSLSSYSILSSDAFWVGQKIEGFNTADLGFGTAQAKTVTLSFLVRSSLTGTFGGSIINNNGTRGYPFSYTISSANTWEQKSITIAGDTTGTWNTTQDTGLWIIFGLGVGLGNSATANTWTASPSYVTSATGATSVVGTNGATFYITGVQLEKGSTATSFDYRPYSAELAMCQRYFETNYATGIAPANGADNTDSYKVGFYLGTVYVNGIPFKSVKRATPTMTYYRPSTVATNGRWAVYSGAWTAGSATTSDTVNTFGFGIGIDGISGTNYYCYLCNGGWTASSEL
jgi:hypothetical protein